MCLMFNTTTVAVEDEKEEERGAMTATVKSMSRDAFARGVSVAYNPQTNNTLYMAQVGTYSTTTDTDTDTDNILGRQL
jgi:hypothetical protein